MLTVTFRLIGKSKPIPRQLYEYMLSAPSGSPPLQAVYKAICRALFIHPSRGRLIAKTTTGPDGKPFVSDEPLTGRAPGGRLLLPQYRCEIVITGWEEAEVCDPAMKLQLTINHLRVQRLLKLLAKAYRTDEVRVRVLDEHGKDATI